MKKTGSFFSSISTKLMMLIISVIFVLSACLMIICILFMGNVLTQGAVTQMNLFCDERGSDLDTELLRIEDAVNSLSKWTESRIPDLDSIREDESLRARIIDESDDLIMFMTESNDFIQSAYIHYTIDITGPVDRDEGTYYSRDTDGTFKTIPFTQQEIAEDPVSEFWYYAPIKAGKAIWTNPYYDGSIDDYLISYVQPVIIDGTPVAVIGIDVSFSRLLTWVDTLSYGETGYMYLKEADGSAHYHIDDLGKEHLHGDAEDELVEHGELMTQDRTTDTLIRYNYLGRDRVMAFVTLRNGMKFVLCDGHDSIYRERDRVVILMVVVSVIMAGVSMGVAAFISLRITDPLRKIASAANEIGEGNYDVVLPPEKNDEVGEVSRSFRLAIDKIRSRSENIRAHVAAQNERIEKDAQTLKKQEDDLVSMRNLAYIDSLTNVKNKHAFEDTASYIDEQIKAGTAEFAVIMCDLNYLKLINDTHGHQEGDRALKKATKILCKAFPMSTVFRIGGDEFVIIPSMLEYARIAEHLSTLKMMLEQQRKSSDDITKRISISYGSAIFDRDYDHSFQEVFERADKQMYEQKQKIHAQDGFKGDNRTARDT
ncbi:sensor domain-containing diguanylate cyclase [Butyrivibrio sp. AE2032]|uniref:sensor domain-containing diguanylate cyclase n=1 Tax=Butyrivibrio sp. AE2032 TaxID=1458463 RepID=UPI0005581911|nr:diguanylate cyclase [Butyrivibrio sp. AE2032]